jgi:aryl-alcohol dehydrogenase-like predicted oxidoreductase
VASVLIGTASLKQLEQNLSAATSPLAPDAAGRLLK